MSLYDVTVNIQLQKVVKRLDFGIPLIMTAGVTASPAQEGQEQQTPVTHAYAEYTSIQQVKEVFGDSDIISVIAALIFKQENAPKRIACCTTTATNLNALKAVKDQNWRQLILTSLDWDGESKDLTDVFDWCEENKRVLFTSTKSTTKFTDFSAKKGTYHHIVVLYYNDTTEQVVFPEAAVVGATAGKKVGSITYKNQILAGVLPMVLEESELKTYHDAGCITIVSKAGDIVTSEGKALSGQYLDITDSMDWLEQQLRYKVQKVLNNNDKVEYTDRGINLLEGAAISVLNEAYDNGMIAEDPDGLPMYWAKFTKREDTDVADRVVRRYIGGNFGCTLSGAVHDVELTGYVEF